jgi:hypothetical protein
LKTTQGFLFRYVGGLMVSLFLCTVGASIASADSVNLTLAGVGGQSAGGVYVYPYYGSINGGPNFNMLCLSFNVESYIGTTWAVNVSGVTDVKDEEAALIMFGMDQGTYDKALGNYAVWGLFDDMSGSTYYQANITAIEAIQANALNEVDNNNLPLGFSYDNYVILSPPGGAPANQVFLAPASSVTPEPTTLALVVS